MRGVTTRQLVLLRHAEATTGGTDDSERQLTGQGASAAQAVGRWLGEHQVQPDAVVASPARRARQTWEGAAAALDPAPTQTVDRRIYENSAAELLAVIRDTAADVGTLLLVGHNPGVHELATVLDDGTGDDEARQRLARRYPPAGVAVFAVGCAWADVGPDTATLTKFAEPGS
jgi:phosphohistidine phosphatase